jgi:hypothetical protein
MEHHVLFSSGRRPLRRSTQRSILMEHEGLDRFSYAYACKLRVSEGKEDTQGCLSYMDSGQSLKARP